MKVQILPEAEEDLLEGFYFYEHNQQGIGQYLLDSLFADIDSLQLYAGLHERVDSYYRMLFKRFPFAIYYKTNSGNALIYAVLDCRLKPTMHSGRLI